MTNSPSLAPILVSAPFDSRHMHAACFDWQEYSPFQALLGFDAQVAGFVNLAVAAGRAVFCLAAPEIYPDNAALASRTPRIALTGTPPLHVRFGSLRTPRLLKGALNVAVLAEDQARPPVRLGHHPFAAGNVAPQGLAQALAYRVPADPPRLIGGGTVPLRPLAPFTALADLAQHAPDHRFSRAMDSVLRPGGLIVQSCDEFRVADWERRTLTAGAEVPPLAVMARQAAVKKDRCVLLPWNLAHPGSLVPSLLDKVQALTAQGRFPLTVLVLPYNDAPSGLQELEKTVAALRARQDPGGAGQGTMADNLLFVRAPTINSAIGLTGFCHRAWLDATDPEWYLAVDRFQYLGLPVSFVSDLADGALGGPLGGYAPGRFAADESVRVQSGGLAEPLLWQARSLSQRTLAALAQAAMRDEDGPLPASAQAPAIDLPALGRALAEQLAPLPAPLPG